MIDFFSYFLNFFVSIFMGGSLISIAFQFLFGLGLFRLVFILFGLEDDLL